MLLGDGLLTRAVARVWRHRERIEREAADQFARLADELTAVAAHPAVIELARSAAADETEHAVLCRRLVDRYQPGLDADPPALGGRLGPAGAPRARRALYASVALSCVTETLSAALLLAMRERAAPGLVRETIHRILIDEVDHGRIGWAHLADEARRGDVSWLAPHVDNMLRAAMTTELAPMSASVDASAHGILPRDEVARVVDRAIAEVIRPGLARFGVSARS